ncbi:MAG TPA: hypothetical protein VNN18_06985 [Candidatus Xenobia bacterium]|nr:hypothetical protein [Candidatus Xenobia bacterium]
MSAQNLFRNWVAGDFRREASEFCLVAQERFGLELNYSPDSLSELDNLIDAEFGPGSADDNAALIVQMGSYVGEVVLRAFGGVWRADEELFHSPAIIIEGRLQARTFPLSRVWQRFEYGDEKSLVAYYDELTRTVARVRLPRA